jgi:hypothetical protein
MNLFNRILAVVASYADKRACDYAERLAVSLWRNHWTDSAPDWKPLSGDLIGILTQIDNMTAGMTRARASLYPDDNVRMKVASVLSAALPLVLQRLHEKPGRMLEIEDAYPLADAVLPMIAPAKAEGEQ